MKATKDKKHDVPENLSLELSKVFDLDISPQNILLDANNPRFVSEDAKRVPDAEIATERAQDRFAEYLREDVGVDDVKDKIENLGYQRHERIFVRPLEGDQKRFVVLEGNRRMTAVKTLLKQHDVGELVLKKEVLASLAKLPCVVYEGTNPDIAWIVQGLRHISGIKNWEPIQQGRFIEKAAANAGLDEIVIGRRFGLAARDTAQIMDALHLFRQAKQNREYGELIDEAKFAMFHEGVFGKRAAIASDFLGYDEKSQKATKESNLTRLLALITSPDKKTPAKIKRAIDVRDKLPELASNTEVLDQIIAGEKQFEEAYIEAKMSRLEKEEKRFNVEEELGELEEACDQIIKLPVSAIAVEEQFKPKFVELLKKVSKIILEHIKLLSK